MEFLHVTEIKVESMGNQRVDSNSHGLILVVHGILTEYQELHQIVCIHF